MLKQFKEKFNREQEIYLRIKVNPGASQTVVSDILADETIKLDIAAAPEKNKANNELIKFLANNFTVSKTNVKILSGQTSRLKLIKITNG